MSPLRRGLAPALLALAALSQAGGQTPSAAYQEHVAAFAAENVSVKAAFKALTETQAYKDALEAKDRDTLNALREKLPKVDRAGFAKKALTLSETAKGDEQARFLTWALENGAAPAEATAAVDRLIQSHLASPVFADFCASQAFAMGLVRAIPDGGRAKLAAIEQQAPSQTVKAWAVYAQALATGGGKDATEEAKAERAALMTKARGLAEGTELAERIDAPEFAKKHLQVGSMVPDIAGEDLDGVAFKLSDYRGKVVVLDFWGDW